MCVLPDGHAATLSEDCTVHVWELAAGACELVLRGHTQSMEPLVAGRAAGRLAGCWLPRGHGPPGSHGVK